MNAHRMQARNVAMFDADDRCRVRLVCDQAACPVRLLVHIEPIDAAKHVISAIASWHAIDAHTSEVAP
jgi:hypothetical protein